MTKNLLQYIIVWILQSNAPFCLGQMELLQQSAPKLLTLELLQREGIGYDTSRIRRRLRGAENESEIVPLFQGMGTHYAFLWIGTPAQRVSVIVDTGSHHTAFPCVGCKCGKHMDPYWDPKKSNTSKIIDCSGKKCFFQQSYSEGSTWHAFKVRDRLWMGGNSFKSIRFASSWSIDFEFGCQDSETGLFRTQNVDGIMGMSAARDTLPHQLVEKGIISTRAFTMCFRVGGGILTLGGLDESIHLPNEKMKYARLMKPSGWFTVRLLDVLLKHPKTGAAQSIGVNGNSLNTGKGAIVDSGTTDTYLPSSAKKKFEDLFHKLSDGMGYSNKNMHLTKAQFDRLPTVVYRLDGLDGDPIDIESPPSSYTENLGGGKYAFRIYLTEGSGTVLGANFMNNHNVAFDIDNMRVGFAKSNCVYEKASAAGTFRAPNFPLSPYRNSNVSSTPNDSLDPDQKAGTKAANKAPIKIETFAEMAGLRKVRGNEQAVGSQTATANSKTVPIFVTCGHQLGRRCTASCSASKPPAEILKDAGGGTSTGAANSNNKGENMNMNMGAGYTAIGTQLWLPGKQCEFNVAGAAKGDSKSSSSIIGGVFGSFLKLSGSNNGPPTSAAAANVTVVESCKRFCAVQPEHKVRAVRGPSGSCFDMPWSDCSASCQQTRKVAVVKASTDTESAASPASKCSKQQQTRRCRVHACPVELGDVAVTLELLVSSAALSPKEWSYVHKEDVMRGLSTLLQVPEGYIYIPHSSMALVGSGTTKSILVVVKIRLPAYTDSSHSEFGRINAVYTAAAEGRTTFGLYVGDKIMTEAMDKSSGFAEALVAVINGNDTNSGDARWLLPGDLTIKVATLAPISKNSKVTMTTSPAENDLGALSIDDDRNATDARSAFIHEDFSIDIQTAIGGTVKTTPTVLLHGDIKSHGDTTGASWSTSVLLWWASWSHSNMTDIHWSSAVMLLSLWGAVAILCGSFFVNCIRRLRSKSGNTSTNSINVIASEIDEGPTTRKTASKLYSRSASKGLATPLERFSKRKQLSS